MAPSPNALSFMPWGFASARWRSSTLRRRSESETSWELSIVTWAQAAGEDHQAVRETDCSPGDGRTLQGERKRREGRGGEGRSRGREEEFRRRRSKKEEAAN
eukprot:764814-Hanusia_phi.AAC.3